MSPPPLIVVMGVSGCGKSTIGKGIAKRLGHDFVEGDDFHPPENVAHMAAGRPLTDAMREPWIAALAHHVRTRLTSGGTCVVAFSGLRAAHRLALRGVANESRWLHLTGSPETIGERLRSRAGHFMPPDLLDSQLAALEPPTTAEAITTVDLGSSPESVLEACLEALGTTDPNP